MWTIPLQSLALPDSIDLALLEFVSPTEWENVLVYGEYVIDKTLINVA